jgi:hypothetical protein
VEQWLRVLTLAMGFVISSITIWRMLRRRKSETGRQMPED